MNKLFLSLLVAASAAFAIPAHAGRDAGLFYLQQKANQDAAQSRDPQKVVLPLGHGPHGQPAARVSSSDEARVAQARANHNAMVDACVTMMQSAKQ